MKVAICDDDRQWLQTAESIIREYADARLPEAEILTVEHPEELDSELPEAPDIVFMDIEFENGAEGIEYAAEINRRVPGCRIVYLTNYLHYAIDVYETDHVWFVIKDQFADRLPAVMDRCIRDIEDSRSDIAVNLKGSGDIVRIRCADIIYVERRPHSSVIVTERERLATKEMYAEIRAKLPDHSFARCHSSITVNISRIDRIHETSVITDNGDSLPISRRYSKQFRQAFMEWASY